MEPLPIKDPPALEKQVCGFEDDFTLSAGSCCDDEAKTE
jgi:hypothetical protein